MKIMTNIYSLRNSKDYLNNIGVEFQYLEAGLFEIAQHNPNIIVTNDSGANKLAADYPAIKVVGPDLDFPNYRCEIPDALLDEITVLSKDNLDIPPCDIIYFNLEPKPSIFHYKLMGLAPNIKFIGNGVGPDLIEKNVAQRNSAIYYRLAKACGATSKEEILKILFMGKPCIVEIPHKYCYGIDQIKEIPKPISGQITYAWQYSHTNVWLQIFRALDMDEESLKISRIMKFNNKTAEINNEK